MKVYLSIVGVNWEGYDVVGVFTNPDNARDFALNSSAGYKDYSEVQCFEVGGGRLEDDPGEFYQEV